MSRLTIVNPKPPPGSARLCSMPRAIWQLGVTPNFIPRAGQFAEGLEGFLGLWRWAASLDKAIQERIALAVAEANACEYCVSARTAIGRGAGLSNDEMLKNRQLNDAKAAAVVALRQGAQRQHGRRDAVEFAAARAAD